MRAVRTQHDRGMHVKANRPFQGLSNGLEHLRQGRACQHFVQYVGLSEAQCACGSTLDKARESDRSGRGFSRMRYRRQAHPLRRVWSSDNGRVDAKAVHMWEDFLFVSWHGKNCTWKSNYAHPRRRSPTSQATLPRLSYAHIASVPQAMALRLLKVVLFAAHAVAQPKDEGIMATPDFDEPRPYSRRDESHAAGPSDARSHVAAEAADAARGGEDSNHRFDPDYHEWRAEQMRQLDRDYAVWRQERYRKFAEEFETWRRQRFSGFSGQRQAPREAGPAPFPSKAAGATGTASLRVPPLGATNALGAERPERAERPDRAERIERSERLARSEAADRAERRPSDLERGDLADRDRPEKGGLLSSLLGSGLHRK